MTEPTFFLEKNTLTIQICPVTLRGGRPVLNGVPVEDWAVEVIRQKVDELGLSFTSPTWNGARFSLSINVGFSFLKGVQAYPFKCVIGSARFHLILSGSG